MKDRIVRKRRINHLSYLPLPPPPRSEFMFPVPVISSLPPGGGGGGGGRYGENDPQILFRLGSVGLKWPLNLIFSPPTPLSAASNRVYQEGVPKLLTLKVSRTARRTFRIKLPPQISRRFGDNSFHENAEGNFLESPEISVAITRNGVTNGLCRGHFLQPQRAIVFWRGAPCSIVITAGPPEHKD